MHDMCELFECVFICLIPIGTQFVGLRKVIPTRLSSPARPDLQNHPDLYAERLRFDRKTLMIAPGDGVFSLSNMGCPGNPNVDGVVSDW